MQDKYVADIGDFGKYALLKHLCQGSATRLGVVWYWVDPDDTDREHQRNDGKHISYLGVNRKNPDLNLRKRDPDLFDQLHGLVTRNERGIRYVESYALLGNDTIFCSDSVSSATIDKKRNDWFGNALNTVENADIVFLDPDNGLASCECDGSKVGHAKFVLRSELVAFWGGGKKKSGGARALVLYHHPGRSTDHDTQIRALKNELESLLPGSSVLPLRYRRGTSRAYFVIVPESNAAQWIQSLNSFAVSWPTRKIKGMVVSDFEFDKFTKPGNALNVLSQSVLRL